VFLSAEQTIDTSRAYRGAAAWPGAVESLMVVYRGRRVRRRRVRV